MAYTHLVSTQEAQATALWAAASAAGHGDKVPPPSVVRERVDSMLADAGRPIDRDDYELRRALGVL